MASLAVRRMVAGWASASRASSSASSFSTTAAARKPHGVGIVAAETYISSRFVAQTELEKSTGVSAGKFTIGE